MSYRDADTAFAARIEALEAENAELRGQLEAVERFQEEAVKKTPAVTGAVQRLEGQREKELVNLRAENELLRSSIDRLEQKLRAAHSEKPPPPPPEPPDNDEALAELREENARLQRALANAKRETAKAEQALADLKAKPEPPPVTDNRDAVIGRLREEIDELRDELRRLRGE